MSFQSWGVAAWGTDLLSIMMCRNSITMQHCSHFPCNTEDMIPLQEVLTHFLPAVVMTFPKGRKNACRKMYWEQKEEFLWMDNANVWSKIWIYCPEWQVTILTTWPWSILWQCEICNAFLQWCHLENSFRGDNYTWKARILAGFYKWFWFVFLIVITHDFSLVLSILEYFQQFFFLSQLQLF